MVTGTNQNFSLSDGGGGWSKMKVSFLVSSQSIDCNHYYLIIWQQPLKFREIQFSILKVRPFDM